MRKWYFLSQKQLDEMIIGEVEKSMERHATALQEKISMKQMNLTSLQSQINPHFLYNALECIRGRAIMDEAPIIVDMAQALANYFRYSISTKNDVVSLREELASVNNYLKIQQFRFSDRFRIEMNMDAEDSILDSTIPKLTLQPIVENCIQHGLERKIGDANIVIDIVSTGNNINIRVSDNGVGMNKSSLKALNERISHYNVLERENPRSGHIGLAMPNINKRLQLLFGDEYGIHVASVENVGTDVEIHIPQIHLDDKDCIYEKGDPPGSETV